MGTATQTGSLETTASTVSKPQAASPSKKKTTVASKQRKVTASKQRVATSAGKEVSAPTSKKTVSPTRPKKDASSQKGAEDKSIEKKASAAVEGKNQKLGRIGEDMACYYLKNNGAIILERNWRCKSGEADLIVEEGNTLAFVEVKTRSEGFPGLPEYAVTRQKRAKYERIATSYLTQNPRPSGRIRFDVIAIQMTGESQCMLRHHRDAYATGE